MEITAQQDILAFALGYLFGSIPFGLILTRLAGLGDVRTIGSGNIGATNVLRTGNKRLAAGTLLGDLLKGTAAVLLARYWFDGSAAPIAGLAAGLGAFLGHLFPVWLGFKGGKGVATFIGVLLAIDWRACLAFGLVWLGIAAATRYSSLSALVASLAAPIVLFVLGQAEASVLFAVLTALVWIKHRANIARLIAGTEPRIGARK
ncbi:MAG TPA: glycerol-3-phosphate 1-O-acyltransferase PlsY [Xanthobacteraceae bacterium]|jgi:glycerol-3-phosphate acyltransferase PlsY|nr:glycerol-3-phosphate 1-O-acyltransferase PlsY [Xanthobacteraceae bacterium]